MRHVLLLNKPYIIVQLSLCQVPGYAQRRVRLGLSVAISEQMPCKGPGGRNGTGHSGDLLDLLPGAIGAATHRGLPSPIKGAHLLDLCDGPVSVAKVPRTSGRPAPADVDYLDLLGLTPGSVVVVPAVATCSSASSTAPTTSGSPPDLESLARARALQLERLKRARQANTLKSLQKAKVTAEKQAAAAAAAWSSAAASLPQPQLSAFWAGAGVYDRVGGNFKCLGLLEPHS